MLEDLTALADDLRRKDPETWEKIERGIPLKPRGQYLTYDNGEIRSVQYEAAFIPFSELPAEVAMNWLQGCLQRACEKRGWPIVLAFDCNPVHPRTWEAEICNGLENGVLGSAKGCPSPAHALLAAYLQALEAMR